MQRFESKQAHWALWYTFSLTQMGRRNPSPQTKTSEQSLIWPHTGHATSHDRLHVLAQRLSLDLQTDSVTL